MKKIITACLAIGLSAPVIALAQDAQQQPAQQNDKAAQHQANQSAEVNQMGGSTQPKQTLSGTVSNQGKTFTSDNKSYIVNNPNSLKGYDDQSVTVVYQFDPDHNSIHILSVAPPQPR